MAIFQPVGDWSRGIARMLTVARAVALPAHIIALVFCGGERPTAPTPTPTATRATCAGPNTTGDPNTSSPPRCVSFEGFDWVIKSSAHFDPGPNAWSDDTSNVWVDAQGLHLKITNRNGRWNAAEVILSRSLGFGTYSFEISTDLARMDRNVVLGLFTYNYLDAAFAHREIDIEFSPLLGFVSGAAGHFTVQPFQRAGNAHDFPISSPWTGTHSFEWRRDRVLFQSRGETWNYTGPDVPPAQDENFRANLWLFQGQPPSNGVEAEVVISRFQFQP